MNVKGALHKNKRALTLIALALSGAIVGMFLLLFALVNNSWVVISLPSAPWSTNPPIALFEARLFAIMGVSFAVGILLTILLVQVTKKLTKQNHEHQAMRIEELEQELTSIHRLLAMTRERQ